MDLVTESNKLSISSTLEKMKDIHPGLFLLRFCCCFVVVLFSFCCGFVLKMDNFVLRRTVVEKESFPHINSLVNSEFNPESTNKGNHRLRIIERFIFLSYLK